VSAVALLQARRSPAGPGLCSCRPPVDPAHLTWTRVGSLRSSGDPSRASAPFQDPGRTDVTSPIAVTSVLPPLSGPRRLRRIWFRG